MTSPLTISKLEHRSQDVEYKDVVVIGKLHLYTYFFVTFLYEVNSIEVKNCSVLNIA